MRFFSNSKFLFIIGALLIALYYAPILVMGENWYIIIHDNLDSSIANIQMLKDLGMVFDYSSQELVAGPVSRSAFRTPWDITILLYTLLPMFWGIVVNNFLARMLAYIGMFLLLSAYVLKGNPYRNLIAVASSLCFAFVSFYSDYGISSMGIPLVIYAFLNLKNSKKIGVSFLSILIFGLYSNLLLSGVFIGLAGGLYYLYVAVRDKKGYGLYFAGLVFLGVIYLCTNVQLVLDFVNGQMVLSHRAEFQTDETLRSTVITHAKLFFVTQYHTGKLITVPIILFCIWQCFATRTLDRHSLYLSISILVIVLFSFFDHLAMLVTPAGHIIQQFQFDRFYFFLPCIWIILLAHTAHIAVQHRHGLPLFMLACALLLACDFAGNKEYIFHAKKILTGKQTEPTYCQFYDKALFTEIKSHIGEDARNCRVASIGLYPAIAQYNGFYCLDGYWNAYPLEYKHEFRKIIARELDKSDDLKNYFDHWGSRCYVYSSELGKNYLFGKDCGVSIHHLDLNTDQLRKMNCQFVFSAVPILNYKELDWDFEKSFTTDQSFWEIYLYRVHTNTQ